MSRAYYNEIDPFAAAWLRALIADGHIAPGDVDERSIEDVSPTELSGYAQCHFFAGIGVWSHALGRAGWPDDRPIWTGSCPCQPFSAAGKGEGFADERHLWPAFFHLIEQCEPAIVVGEQVASGGAGVWFDLVQADLEGMGYAFGLVPLPAAGFGGAHIRDRAFWVADSTGARLEGAAGPWAARPWRQGGAAQRVRHVSGLAYANGGHTSAERQQCSGKQRFVTTDGGACGLADANSYGTGYIAGAGLGAQAASDGIDGRLSWQRERSGINCALCGLGHNSGASAPMLGRDPADWLFCRDGKWRPVGPGSFPLADEAPARVGRLRGYGNAIDAEALTQFIEAVADTLSSAVPSAALSRNDLSGVAL